MYRNLVLLFDGIGEVIGEKTLGKDPVITERYLRMRKHFQEVIEKELNEFPRRSEEEENHVKEWIDKYLYDCCMYERWKPYMEVEAAVPYSIGLITALACLQGIRIEDGIRLIVSSYFYSKGKGEKEMMLMMVAGFEKREIAAMIEQARETGNVFQAAELGDIYMLLSGLKDSMEKLYPVFIENGAMKTAKLPAPVAYHTPLAKKHIQEFESCVRDIEVKDIRIPICSIYSNQMLCRKEQLQRELVINLYRKMNAAGCIEAIMQKRERIFFEIGAGKSLYKIYRSINGEINILKNLREGN